MLLLTSHIYFDIITILLGIITALYFYLTSTYGYWQKRNVPFAKPTIPFGNLFDLFAFHKNSGQIFADLYNSTTEKLYGFFAFRRPYLLIRDPELIKHVLVKDFQCFSDRSSGLNESDIVGTGNLFTIKNPHWKFLRTKLTPLFTSGKLKQMFPLVVKIGDQLNEYLNEKITTGSSEEVKEYCAKYTTDVLASTSFGIEANSLRDEHAEFRKVGRKLFTYTNMRSWELICFFFAPAICKLLRFKLFSDFGTAFMRDLFWQTIKVREESNIKRPDVIDALIQLKNRGSVDNEEIEKETDLKGVMKFEGDYLVAQVGVFYTAGFETTSGAMSFTLYNLALNPAMQAKLRNEICSVLKNSGGLIQYEDIAKMKYLDCCFNETLRLYPTLPFLERECKFAYTFPGTNITIEPGTVVIISLDGLQRDSTYFKNPTEYDPDRWNDENKSAIIPYTYLPFGEGPHNCIGSRFGMISTKVGLIQILKDFEVLVNEKTQVPLKMDTRAFLTAPINGIHLQIRKLS